MAGRVSVVLGRVPLQKATVQRLGDPSAKQIEVWLFMVDPGHFRVFSAAEVRHLFDLDEMRAADALSLETREERERLAALRLRLIETEIIPDKRLKLPSEAFDACGEHLDRSHVWLEQAESRLDVYTATYMQRLLSFPPSTFLPTKVPIKE